MMFTKSNSKHQNWSIVSSIHRISNQDRRVRLNMLPCRAIPAHQNLSQWLASPISKQLNSSKWTLRTLGNSKKYSFRYWNFINYWQIKLLWFAWYFCNLSTNLPSFYLSWKSRKYQKFNYAQPLVTCCFSPTYENKIMTFFYSCQSRKWQSNTVENFLSGKENTLD